MTGCLDTDAKVAIGNALDWDVQEGLRHLEHCEDCQTELEVLRLARMGLLESAPVDAAVVRRVAGAVRGAAGAERQHALFRERWMRAGEAVVAGLTAVIIAISSNAPVDSVAALLVAFGSGAGLLLAGRALTESPTAPS